MKDSVHTEWTVDVTNGCCVRMKCLVKQCEVVNMPNKLLREVTIRFGLLSEIGPLRSMHSMTIEYV